jgi:hypothetical protein
MRAGLASPFFALAAFAIAPPAQAQYFDDELHSMPDDVESPEMYALELRIGPYLPDGINRAVGGATNEFSDRGPMLAVEFDVLFLDLPYVGLFGVGAGLGWSEHGGTASTADMATNEKLSFTTIPLTAVAVLRIDVLARELGIPFTFAGKLGFDAIFWDSNKGETDEESGTVFGLRWALQAALELDFFDRAAARALDEEWGINHSFVFFEYYGAEAQGSPVVGDRTWALGLGFTF